MSLCYICLEPPTSFPSQSHFLSYTPPKARHETIFSPIVTYMLKEHMCCKGNIF